MERWFYFSGYEERSIQKTNATPGFYNAIFVSKKEHIFGKKLYGTKAQFWDNGQNHNLSIECDTVGTDDPFLAIRIDKVFWDVHNWLFGPSVGNAVFMFQTCSSAEKLWSSQPFFDSSALLSPCSQNFREFKLQGLGFSLILYAWKNE
ncbi:hypothetical protein CK203_075834 [Vitis vinifera]|uniref:Uncharacterized protein n=1 Tax=Vitis vinifera TaxID=29760 RepID=A0A438F768_VITVI|nr:hypothetical protein CK203_075834 [Vitis vinifera]